MMPRPLKIKRCKVCKNEYQPYNSMQKVCNPVCAQKYVAMEQEKKKLNQWRKEKKDWQEKNKSLNDRIAEAQRWFNAYIRERDYYQGCICCGKFHDDSKHLTGSGWDAGHYRSRGSAPHMRFNEDNCHKQLSGCNSFLSGNIVEYRKRLIEKIGLERVEAVENNNDVRKFTKEELIEIKEKYKRMAKELKRDRESK